ncbi:MAG TPA: aspartate-semialdehyde dehydrogenase [Saprospiraceae bacterium]|nr:aspartate-semialdehyde dehydrogenase [Saprospiraceae bacterium]
MKKYNLAVVGATGMVGQKMLEVLEERKFPVGDLYLCASEKSAGKKQTAFGKEHTLISVEELVDHAPDIAIFSAGSEASLQWAEKLTAEGTTVIDNSSAWRMHEKVPLIVPEINADMLTSKDLLIANPNCSTIQLVMAMHPLHQKYGIKRLVLSTYQSVSGSGIKALEQLKNEEKGLKPTVMAYPYAIYRNTLPHCDVFLENDYTKEEMKMVYETRKILRDQHIAITSTAVRVPVHGGHSISVNAEMKSHFEVGEIRSLLDAVDGLVVRDDPGAQIYPMPIEAFNRDEVFVGRIRKDDSVEHGLNLWVVADNIRKGAATNAVQIAEYLIKRNLK